MGMTRLVASIEFVIYPHYLSTMLGKSNLQPYTYKIQSPFLKWDEPYIMSIVPL